MLSYIFNNVFEIFNILSIKFFIFIKDFLKVGHKMIRIGFDLLYPSMKETNSSSPCEPVFL